MFTCFKRSDDKTFNHQNVITCPVLIQDNAVNFITVKAFPFCICDVTHINAV